MILQRFEVPGLAHYSYLIASEGQAVVIDPQRDTSVYVEFARSKGVTIAHVLETHIHADYASGSPALTALTGAQLWLSAYDANEQFRVSNAASAPCRWRRDLRRRIADRRDAHSRTTPRNI